MVHLITGLTHYNILALSCNVLCLHVVDLLTSFAGLLSKQATAAWMCCLCPFRASAVPWQHTWSSSSKMRSVMECVSAGMCGPPAGWRPQGWSSPWPVFWPRWRSVLICRLCSMNQCFVAGQLAKRCSTHSGMNFLAVDVQRGCFLSELHYFLISLFLCLVPGSPFNLDVVGLLKSMRA